MTIRKNLLVSGLAGLTLLVTAATAFAAPAVATSNVNVRSGPGTGYSVVDSLRRGEPVDVQQCRGSWCYVEKRGPDGWVSANYLERGGRGGGYAVNPGVTLEFNFGNAPQRPHYPRPPRPDHGGWYGGNDGGWNPPPRPRPPVYDPPPRPPHWNPRPPRPQPYPIYPANPGASFCFNGPNGYFCAGN